MFAAATLDGGTLEDARLGLESLYADHLLDEPSPGRYRLHDLLRDYARRLAQQDEVAGSQAAVDRLLEYYVSTAIAASRHLVRSSYGSVPFLANVRGPSPDLTTREASVAWLAAERADIGACVQYAATHSRERPAVDLAHAVRPYLQSAGHWDELLANSQVAVNAARRTGDRAGLAIGLMDLGCVQRLIGESPAAFASLSEALELTRKLNDSTGQARALTEIGVTQRTSAAEDGRAAATRSFLHALKLFREAGDQLGQADTLRLLGMTRQEASDYATAAEYLGEALTWFGALGDRRGEADVLASVGRVYYWTGEYLSAADTLRRCCAIFRDLGNALGEANALNDLGRVECQLGDYRAATASHLQALKLYRDLRSRIGEENALAYLAVVQRATGDIQAAHQSLMEALSIARELDDGMGQANVLTELAFVQRVRRDHAAARSSVDQALAIARAIGDTVGETEALNCLGSILLDLMQTDAILHFRMALDLARKIACPLEEARALEGMGLCLTQTDGPRRGKPVLRQALAIYERMQTPDVARLNTSA